MTNAILRVIARIRRKPGRSNPVHRYPRARAWIAAPLRGLRLASGSDGMDCN